jgi:hypothetical protein
MSTNLLRERLGNGLSPSGPAVSEWINKIATHDSVRPRTSHNHLESAPKIARSGDRAYHGAGIAVFPVGRVPSRGDFVELQNRLLEPI